MPGVYRVRRHGDGPGRLTYIGQKGRGLFHPIRVALTGEADGPELDLLVPAIDRAAELQSPSGLAPVTGCRERAAAFAQAL